VPVPTALPPDWRQELVDELRRRVVADELWGWQGNYLAERIRGASPRGTIALFEYEALVDVEWAAGLPMRRVTPEPYALAPLMRDRLTPERRLLVELIELHSVDDPWLSVAVRSARATGAASFGVESDASFLGSKLVWWNSVTASSFAALIEATRASRPGAPAPVVERGDAKPSSTYVYDVRGILTNRLLHWRRTAPPALASAARERTIEDEADWLIAELIRDAVTPDGPWTLPIRHFNGRLIIPADMDYHRAIERHLSNAEQADSGVTRP
jgi:hypothetical protein